MRHWLLAAGTGNRDLLAFARGVEDAGFTGVVVCDQLFFPEVLETRYHGTASGEVTWTATTPFPDPWCAISAMAAVTERLEFGTFTYVAPLRSLFTVAKAVATTAVISGDRTFFGASIGWNREQYRAEGLEFDARGRRLEEMLAALPLLWSGEVVEFSGEFFRFPPLSICPVPARPVPIMLGGDSERAMDRAARLGDGWLGRIYDTAEALRLAARLHRLLERHGRDPSSFEIVVGVEDATAETLAELGAGGVTGVLLFPPRRARGEDAVEAAHFEHTGSTAIEEYLDDVRRLAGRLELG